ncbi:MAG: threonine--tRNA ligase [Pirellulaceae bacterium]|jgi:threonyl-tRNA synthetase|nr:threonine--tRNA ligase [Pirellulaceae bacterium]
MPKITLPDGSTRQYDHPVTPLDVAAEIGSRLAKAAVAAVVNGTVVGLDYVMAEDEQSLAILTDRDPEALKVLRHSCAHVMARAVMRIRENVQLAFGPVTSSGFYYDFDLGDKPLSESDFEEIEAEMRKIIELDEPFERVVEPRDKAVEICRDLDQQYKVEHIAGGLNEQDTVSFYRQGEFVDLCRGPHIPSPGKIGAFKLQSLAGAYWLGDQNGPQLQRLYGTAFFKQKALDAHLARIEEQKKRDHRELGRKLDLFEINPDKVGQGLILWLPKGAMIRGMLESFVREELEQRGYQTVYTPNIGRLELYETSGHFPYYRDSQFAPLFTHDAGQIVDYWLRQLNDPEATLSADEEQQFARTIELLGCDCGSAALDAEADADKIEVLRNWEGQQERYLLKPMNCPHHVMCYKARRRSYRDLPVRLAEFGTVYRAEQSGELNGMTRVRGFTQDDAHIFCTDEQVAEEFRGCIEMTQFVLKCLGLKDYRVRLGFRDPDSDKYVGNPEQWDIAQAALATVCRNAGLDAEPEVGEAAFYGPKADFVVTDCLGREWQLGTVQLDYNLPERFELEYVGADNAMHRPVMIHRAPLGSMERFMGVLIEHFAGAFPLWLAPEQIRVLTVSEKSEDYGREVEQALRDAKLRVKGDYRPEKLGAKIRDARHELIPYILVVGPRDAEAGTVSIRCRVDGDIGAVPLEEAIGKFQAEIDERLVRVTHENDPALGGGKAQNEY